MPEPATYDDMIEVFQEMVVKYDQMIDKYDDMTATFQELTAVLIEIRDAVGPTIEGLKSSPIAGMMGLK